VALQYKSGFLDQAMPQYGLEAAYARNGQDVLQLMHEGMKRAVALARPEGELQSACGKEEERMAHLEKMLPWLPAYDRRDALVVRNLIHAIGRTPTRLGRSRNRLDARQLDNDDELRALAASCFTAALMKPSDGDTVGALKIDAWLRQKGIELQMELPIHLAALTKHAWTVFRGSPDVLVTPTGRLRVPTPPVVAPAGGSQWTSQWDVSEVEPVAELPLAVQVVPFHCCCISTTLFMLTFVVTLIVDLSTTANDADHVVLRSTLLGVSFTVPLFVLSVLSWAMSLFLLPWVYAHPHGAHAPSYGATFGAVGDDALKELGVVFFVSLLNIPLITFFLILIDTAAFSQPFALLSSAFTAELANASHPGVAVASTAYASFLAAIHAWSLWLSLLASITTWHMWNCGRRSGARYMLMSPDSKKATVVSFARPADTQGI
jgi:hypothetical protein